LGGLLKSDLSAHAVGPISISSHRQILQVSTNTFHTAAVTSTGEVYTSGSNEEGQASDVLPYDQTIATPRLLESLLSHRITQVACGLYHTVCVTSAGLVISFGGNEAGQLGHSPEAKTRVGPRLVQSLQSKICTRVACG
jgi:E3 ubiquitin-protein ligase HERC4